MKSVALLSLLLLVGCAEPPTPAAPSAKVAPVSAITHDNLATDTFELGGSWVSLSLQGGTGARPVIAMSISAAFDPGVKSDAVSAKLLSNDEALVLSRGPQGEILPAAGNFAFGAGTSLADFTFENAQGLPLTEIEVTFNGATKRFAVASLKRFPEDFVRS